MVVVVVVVAHGCWADRDLVLLPLLMPEVTAEVLASGRSLFGDRGALPASGYQETIKIVPLLVREPGLAPWFKQPSRCSGPAW